MGTLIMTPNYTNLFIHLLEQHFIYNSPSHSNTRKSKAEFHRWLLYHWNINTAWTIGTLTFTSIAHPHCILFFFFSNFQRKTTFYTPISIRNTSIKKCFIPCRNLSNMYHNQKMHHEITCVLVPELRKSFLKCKILTLCWNKSFNLPSGLSLHCNLNVVLFKRKAFFYRQHSSM